MVFLSFLNLGLAFLYYFFATYQIMPVGWAVAGGIALAFLFNYLWKARSAGEVLLTIVATNLVVLLLSYSFTLIWTNDHISLFMIGLCLGAVFCTFLATVFFLIGSGRVYSVIGWMATCATVVNSLPLISYFWTIATA